MHKKVLIHKDLISNISHTSVHLVYQKLNKTNPLLDFTLQAGWFYVEHPLLYCSEYMDSLKMVGLC
jgi:hypothetical protein